MTDRRLSEPELFDTCEHICCLEPNEPNHMHLFDTDICPVCRGLASRRAHPSNVRRKR